MNIKQAFLLSSQLPVEVSQLSGDYIHLIANQPFLLSSSFEVEGYFVALDILKADKSKKTWQVRIPIQYALAVVDGSNKEGMPIGFLS